MPLEVPMGEEDRKASAGLALNETERALLEEAARELGLDGEVRDGLSRKGKGFFLVLMEETWEELAGYLSVQANRTEDASRQRRLDGLIERIEDLLLYDPDEEP